MAQYTLEILSGSTDGRMVKVAATASAGTTIHTADSSAKDEIYLEAVNTSAVPVKLTIEFGGTTSPDDTVIVTIPAQDGPFRVIPGWILTNSLVVKAFAADANVILIGGHVNRIT